MPYIGRTPTNAALTAADLADGIVSTAKIAADAVTDAKIADDVVGTEHLTANEVDTAALGADAVTGAQLADNAVNSEHYTDGSIDTAHIADAQITAAKMFSGFANGITSASQFRLTTSFTGDAAPIASNWEEVDTDGYGRLGTAVSQSSGIFTFPATGIWHIISVMTHIEGSAAIAYALNKIETTTNNSSYGTATASYNSFEGNGYYMTNSSNFIFDVTDTSTHKVRLSTNAADTSTTTMGDTDINRTYITFIRLGAT